MFYITNIGKHYKGLFIATVQLTKVYLIALSHSPNGKSSWKIPTVTIHYDIKCFLFSKRKQFHRFP